MKKITVLTLRVYTPDQKVLTYKIGDTVEKKIIKTLSVSSTLDGLDARARVLFDDESFFDFFNIGFKSECIVEEIEEEPAPTE